MRFRHRSSRPAATYRPAIVYVNPRFLEVLGEPGKLVRAGGRLETALGEMLADHLLEILQPSPALIRPIVDLGGGDADHDSRHGATSS